MLPIFNELVLFHRPWIYLMLGLFSLAVGSFLNVLIYRLPLMLQATWRKECRQLLQLPEEPAHLINLCYPRSFCIHCKKMIAAWQNIPVLSYLFLRGRCANCQYSIPISYPLIELLCMGLSLSAGIVFGINATLLFALLFIWLSIGICFIDIKHQLIPDSLSLSLLWLGLIANTQSFFTPLPWAIFGAAGAYLGLWLVIKLFYLCTGKVGMGHGDFKLFAALGAWFGVIQLPIILIMASMSGAIVGMVYLHITKQTRETPIPFGPFLCIAGLISLFFGKKIMTISLFVPALS